MVDENGGTGLPASIEAAWGIRRRPGKGPRPGLTLPRIVQAAMDVAEAEGLPAVSMSRIAAELGVSTMSLYRYVAAKDELLMLMLDAAAGPPPEPPPGLDWRGGLTWWSRQMMAAHRRSPWTVQIPVFGPPTTPNQLRWMEQGLRALAGTPLREDEKLGVMLMLSIFLRSQAALLIELETAFHGKQDDTEVGAPAGYSALLRRLLDPRDFPAMHAVIDAGIFDSGESDEEDFRWALDRILDGVARLFNE
ncbi:TetR family transcriptional regulator [Spongiactinospora gelatinilytica]|uniref:TetR family transcriptional regulator n=1 Tax=Spongiactinospora gelatinilytica TaxID=2666298 RepID=A0A2W2GLM2_9ACTN|nr:TetR/AcrR family transcriptional regulator [Spongiactinospora gelatinilytica]PZG40985.1 TetR family transcriptional regulator [Spongiactinospora gelatinilytica]